MDEIKEAGNESLRRGDNYDALWKYNHALVLCRNHNLPLPKVAVVSSNCSQACINLKYYMDAFSHADHAIRTDPLSNIVHKVHVHVCMYMYIHNILRVLMRDGRRKKERSKQGQTNNKAEQHSTPKAVIYTL